MLGPVPTANLAFIYFSDRLADDAEAICSEVKARTQVRVLSGSAGIGVCCTGLEFMDIPAVVVLALELPNRSVREVLSGDDLLAGRGARFGIAHLDPTQAGLVSRAPDFDGSYFVGGLTSARGKSVQICTDGVATSGATGVVLSDEVGVATGMSQGCTPLGAWHRVTGGYQNLLTTLDDRPALEVLMEDAAEITGGDPRNLGDGVLVGVGLPNRDTDDSLVRNLMGVSIESGAVAIGHDCRPGDRVQFVRRDAAAARIDMQRMLDGLAKRTSGRPWAGLYFSCVARGRHLFGEPAVELEMIRDTLGEFPLVGFFGNGEICHHEVYGHTGVLALFTPPELVQ